MSFSHQKTKRDTNRANVESFFNLQQAVLDGLEYLEENQRELPIWGIPPFGNHQVQFHPEHAPSHELRRLIDDEMGLVEKDFRTIIGHWLLLKSKVSRHLDVLIQLRVLDQQELAVKQRDMAVLEAKNSRLQSRSVMVFTAITVVFLPLSFCTSYFGMNVTDILGGAHDSKFFWMISGPISACVILGVFAAARFMVSGKEPDIENGVDVVEQHCSGSLKANDDGLWMTLRPRFWKLKVS
jgi:Mg2+ and Co2+ transporter CorA